MKNNILFYGSKEDLPGKIELKAGQLDLVYEHGFIRYIKAGNKEVIRMINFMIRDYNWGTPGMGIYNEHLEQQGNSFFISYQAEVSFDAVHFLWNCSISGREDSSVIFSIEGESMSAFRRNRIGFTVLHPIIECAGQNVKITHPDNSHHVYKFPELISPNQPFFDISKMEWDVGGNTALLEFSGDVFESEDQRNWMDESYKTYCTPLKYPYPVDVNVGDKVKQEIKLEVKVKSISIGKEAEMLTFAIDRQPFSLPKIGIGQSNEIEKLSPTEIGILKALAFDHYSVDLKLYEDWDTKWKRATTEANAMGLPLEVKLFFRDIPKELADFISTRPTRPHDIFSIQIFNKSHKSTQNETIKAVLPALRAQYPDTLIGGGTNAFFTELNRDRTPSDKLDFLVYSFNPQVHAFDNNTLVENIYAQPYAVQTAKNFSNGKSIHISPVTLKMRGNPDATGEKLDIAGQLPDDADVRQMSLFGASWVLGTFNSLLTGTPESITFFETIGLKGIMQSSEPLHADQFFADKNALYPMYFIFKYILRHKEFDFYHVVPSAKLKFTGLAFGKKNEPISVCILANFSGEDISVRLPSELFEFSFAKIDEHNATQAMQDADFLEKLSYENNVKTGNHANVQINPYGLVFGKKL